MGPVRDPATATAQTGGQWHRRPVLSHALRVVVFAGPAAASFGIAALLARSLPRAGGVASAALWIVLMASASLLSLVVFERAARRLLPLAALLNVSLLFPDRAPARFAVARQTGSPRELRARLDSARAEGQEDDARRIQTVVELALALSVHDRQSRGHSERVRVFTDLLADELKLAEADRGRLRWAALLHDIGKLEVPSALLKKPGKPTPEEWVILHRHPAEGARLVAPLLPWLGEWGTAVEQHHERFDGTGYPHRLRAGEISLAARIVAVADCYEVMTAPRPYKRALSVSAARRELVRVAGSQLDPVIVRAFLNVSVGRLWRTIGVGAWVAQVPTLGRLFSLGGWAGSGVATATTATVLAVGGIAGTGSGPALAGPATLAPSVLSAPAHHSRQSPPGFAPLAVSPVATTATSPGPSTSLSADASPTPAPIPTATPRATPVAGPSGAASPTPAPSAAPNPVPASPTSAPIAVVVPPSPTPVPTTTPASWNCSACTNTAMGCTTYCSASGSLSCFMYCSGDNNTACTSYCLGNNDTQCVQYCQGTNHPACQVGCQATVMAFIYEVPTGGERLSTVARAALSVGWGVAPRQPVDSATPVT